MPTVIEKLEQQREHCNEILKSNNISEIKAFTDTLMGIAKQYPISLIYDYAEKLTFSIDSFDITGIKYSLNEYSLLIDKLTELK
ncbi:MAG: hypothetical protein V3U71_14445 [Cocleimonas sp.]